MSNLQYEAISFCFKIDYLCFEVEMLNHTSTILLQSSSDLPICGYKIDRFTYIG